ncbi:hypothetical protein AncyloWKF20_17220 [Ancylobacter sp. WKF20]|uniref:hypothetical protein n=1 Tax=Ancylobacter sp. WKF20 TaxID=3039801 RepID=UPI0024343EF3|nr:hypothetical protein [Ancylobacter sp. WKF20]WGD29493.1 hypothetical protein AncyloWKF20_17220 [Ancylobacter sp. WKF20]
MTNRLSLAFAALLLASTVASASPCTQAADDTQAALDRMIADLAAGGPPAPESDAALLSHDPSPSSMAKVEAEIGDGVKPEIAQKALERARAAAAAGNEDGCQKEVAAARDAIGLQ